MTFKVYKTTPFVVEKIWGGGRLAQFLNLGPKQIGETWHASTLKEGPSGILSQTKKLSDYVKLPYLFKLIDTSDHLSIQVHPDDEYAKAHQLESGKTECWLILDAAPGAGIYVGFKQGVNKEDFFKEVKNSSDVSKFLNFFDVKPGDFFYIPAGTIHAIGKDVFLAEVQQSSGVTYRVWDWNRTDDKGRPRELHVNEAAVVTNFDKKFNQQVANSKKMGLLSSTSSQVDVIDHSLFQVKIVNLNGNSWQMNAKRSRPLTLFTLKGRIEIKFEKNGQNKSEFLSQWQCLVCDEDNVNIELGSEAQAQILIIS